MTRRCLFESILAGLAAPLVIWLALGLAPVPNAPIEEGPRCNCRLCPTVEYSALELRWRDELAQVEQLVRHRGHR